MKRFIQFSVFTAIAWGCPLSSLPSSLGQETTKKTVEKAAAPSASKSEGSTKQAAYEIEFAKYLSGSKLTGLFTVDGQPLNNVEAETYEIKSAKKIDGFENLWEIVCRIQYGDKDIEVPIEIEIHWIGKTPLMVLDSVTVPGMGTFSARVVFHDKKYAGTWKHDDKGGHVLGRIVQNAGQTR